MSPSHASAGPWRAGAGGWSRPGRCSRSSRCRSRRRRPARSSRAASRPTTSRRPGPGGCSRSGSGCRPPRWSSWSGPPRTLAGGDPRLRGGGRAGRWRAVPRRRARHGRRCRTPSRRTRSAHDGRTVYEVVTLDLSPDRSPDALEPLEAAIVAAARPGDRRSPAAPPSTATSSRSPRRTSSAAS